MKSATVYRWWLSQENRTVASQILQLAHRLGVSDTERWAAGVLAQASKRALPNGPSLLQTAHLAVLARQTDSSAAPAVLSVPEIRQLAQSRSNAQPASTPKNTRSLVELEKALLGIDTEYASVAFFGNSTRVVSSTPNQEFASNLLASEENVANHFSQRTFSDRPGQTPTTYVFGGQAAEGLFSKITGKTYTEIATNILTRVDDLVKSGELVKIGAGGSNGVYLHKPTQQIVRIGRVRSGELQSAVGFTNIDNKGVGAKLDLSKSLYMPNELISASETTGLAVLFMERVPGLRPYDKDFALAPGAREKVMPAVADALVSMHLNNKAHGDFGSHNLMVTPTGGVRVIDFGLSSSIKGEWKVSNDLGGMTDVLMALYPASVNYGKERIRAMVLDFYTKAVDRLVGPDRNAGLYKQHPELYDAHVARFNAKKDALKQNAAAAFK